MSEAPDSFQLASSSVHSAGASLGQKHRLRGESRATGDFHVRPLASSCGELQTVLRVDAKNVTEQWSLW